MNLSSAKSRSVNGLICDSIMYQDLTFYKSQTHHFLLHVTNDKLIDS